MVTIISKNICAANLRFLMCSLTIIYFYDRASDKLEDDDYFTSMLTFNSQGITTFLPWYQALVEVSCGALKEFANQLHTLMTASQNAVRVIPTLGTHQQSHVYADQVPHIRSCIRCSLDNATLVRCLHTPTQQHYGTCIRCKLASG